MSIEAVAVRYSLQKVQNGVLDFRYHYPTLYADKDTQQKAYNNDALTKGASWNYITREINYLYHD